MTRHIRPLFGAAVSLLLAACASAPMHYYTLLPPVAAIPLNSVAPIAFELLPVRVPAQVDQPQLVVREGGQSVAMLEGHRWIAPLADEVRAALGADLVRQLPGRNLTGMSTGGQSLLQVSVDLRRFDSQLGSYALIEGAWSVRLLHGAKPAVLACTSEISESVGPGYDALVQGHQRALAELASQVATAARSLAANQRGSCPSE
ncbi:MAG: PqiC family protein [Rhodanobacter sp.]